MTFDLKSDFGCVLWTIENFNTNINNVIESGQLYSMEESVWKSEKYFVRKHLPKLTLYLFTELDQSVDVIVLMSVFEVWHYKMYKVNFVVDRFLQERHTNGINHLQTTERPELVNGVNTSNHIGGKIMSL